MTQGTRHTVTTMLSLEDIPRFPAAVGAGLAVTAVVFLWWRSRFRPLRDSSVSSGIVSLVLGIAGSLLAGAISGGTVYYVIDPSPVTTTTTVTTTPTNITSTVQPTTTTPTPRLVAVTKELIPEYTFGYQIGQSRINAKLYTEALIMSACCDPKPRELQIDAGRTSVRFRGELGIPDTERSSYSYRVRVELDGGPSGFDTEVVFGRTYQIDLPVEGVLRIKIIYTPTSSDCCGPGNRYIAIGFPTLVRSL